MGYAHNFDLSNHGRILLLWDMHKVDVDIILTTEQYIHCRVCCRISGRGFLVTFVYGLHSIVTRRPLWEALSDLGDTISEAWMIMGDFNSFLSIHEKQGGSPVTNHEMRDMQIFTQACGLVDLRSVGCRLTWSNGTVSCKLDRALVNSFWLMEDFDAYAEFTAPGCLSDHSCTIVHTLAKDRAPNRPFKFLNMWTLHKDFLKVVGDSWAAPVIGNAQFILKTMFRLKKCLRELNKNHFGHITEKAKRAKDELMEIQKGILDGGPIPSEYSHVRKKTTLLMEAERQFFQQRAKNVYLRNSDKCTKFFHDVVKRNNKRNAIIMLKKRDEEQTTSLGEVAEEFIDYFHGLLGQKEVCAE
ncbi:uncharacterized protein LOC122023053 [Zingiber officinale]|uniref:uncharacterized protein LOC122023053 n=1 Tax=Zingiber officinale TaxID=94328 RepID=UPI001C4BC928|nr:uncharacterized protein LOC122023053 [Zingiber officinale]